MTEAPAGSAVHVEETAIQIRPVDEDGGLVDGDLSQLQSLVPFTRRFLLCDTPPQQEAESGEVLIVARGAHYPQHFRATQARHPVA